MKRFTLVFMPMLVTLVASACALTQPITEPVSVIEAFYEALNDGDLDTAMSFVADDARFILGTLHTGKAKIRDFYAEGLRVNLHSELSDLRADGDKVSWTGKVTLGGGTFEDSYEAVVQKGMILSLTPR